MWPISGLGGAFHADFLAPVKYQSLSNQWHGKVGNGKAKSRLNNSISSSGYSDIDCLRFTTGNRPVLGIRNRQQRSANRPYSRGRLGSFFIHILEQREAREKELAARPVITIEEPYIYRRALRISYQGQAKSVSASFIAVRVGSENAALGVKVGGTVTPPLGESSVAPYGWIGRPRNFRLEVVTSAPLDDKNAIEEIAGGIAENVLQEQIDLIPGLGSPAVIGFCIQDSPFLCVGEYAFDTPSDGKIRVIIYNQAYGILAEKWFNIKIPSWDKITFPVDNL